MKNRPQLAAALFLSISTLITPVYAGLDDKTIDEQSQLNQQLFRNFFSKNKNECIQKEESSTVEPIFSKGALGVLHKDVVLSIAGYTGASTFQGTTKSLHELSKMASTVITLKDGISEKDLASLMKIYSKRPNITKLALPKALNIACPDFITALRLNKNITTVTNKAKGGKYYKDDIILYILERCPHIQLWDSEYSSYTENLVEKNGPKLTKIIMHGEKGSNVHALYITEDIFKKLPNIENLQIANQLTPENIDLFLNYVASNKNISTIAFDCVKIDNEEDAYVKKIIKALTTHKKLELLTFNYCFQKSKKEIQAAFKDTKVTCRFTD